MVAQEYAQYPWLFKGAYAIYSGTTKLKGIPGEFEATERVEVVDIDYSKKRVRIRSSSSAIQRLWRLSKKMGEEEIEEWVRIGDRIIFSDEAILEGEYEGVLRVEGLGLRKCIVQQYSKGLHTIVVFWDKEFNWPLKYVLVHRRKSKDSSSILSEVMSMSKDLLGLGMEIMMGETANFEDKRSKSEALTESSLILHLKETNIPGLKCE